MGAPNPDIAALVNTLAMQYWTPANVPDLSGVIATVTGQLGRLGGVIDSAVISFANEQVTAVWVAEEALEEAHGGPVPGDSGVTTMGAFGAAPAAEGASIAGTVLTMQPADATNPGEVSTGAQTFAGLKTFAADAVLGTGAVSAAPSTLKTCAAAYAKTSAQTVARNTPVIIDYATSVYDTDAAVTTGAAWHFTTPAGKAGLYNVNGRVKITTNATTSRMIFAIFKNGASFQEGGDVPVFPATDNTPAVEIATVMNLAAGDTIDFRLNAIDSAADVALSVGANVCWVNITRVPGS